MADIFNFGDIVLEQSVGPYTGLLGTEEFTETQYGDVINDLIYLDFADYLATSQNNFDNYPDHYNDLRKIYFRIMQFRSDKIKKYDKIIDGKEIMKIFGLNEGPEVGRVLDAIQDDIINNGNIKKSEAIKLAKKILNN